MTKKKNNNSVLITVIFGCIGVSLFSFQLSFVLTQWPTYVLLLSVLVLFLSEKYVSIQKFIHKYQLFLIVLLSTIIIGTLFRENLSARWGPIDDHEIMEYLGEDQKFGFSEIPQTLISKTEVGRFGESLRYRPAYYLLRLTETAIWGNNPHLWYGFRLTLLVISLSIYWKLLSKILGFIPSGLFIIYSMTLAMWADMFTRLGPAEIYTVLSFSLYAWAMNEMITSTLRSKPIKMSPIVIWTLATIALAGTKENFTLLLMPNLLIIGFLAFKKRITPVLTTAFLISVASILFVAAAVSTPLVGAGSDIYGNSVAPISRLNILITGMKHADSKKMIVAGVFLAAIAVFQVLQRKKNQQLFKTTLLAFTLITSYHFIFISQYVFYNGDWPNHSRYDFPGIFVIPFFYITLICYAYLLMKQEKVSSSILKGLRYGILIGFVSLIVMRGFVDLRVRVKKNAEITIAFTNKIESIASVANNNPTRPVVIESRDPWDYEVIFAYAKFLKAHGVKNDLYLRLHDYSSETVGVGIEQRLAKTLEKIGNEGNDDFSVLPKLLENCYSVLLKPIEINDCETL